MKKLLIATSALVVAAPAFADVTLSGKLDMTATTNGGQSASNANNTATLVLSMTDGTISGGATMDLTSTGATASGFNVSAATSLGTFTIGKSAIKRDADITELEVINATGSVGTEVAAESALSYKNTFGDLAVGISWGTGVTTSLGFDAGGFAVTVDADQSNNYILNATGDFAGQAVKVEYDNSADWDLAVGGTIGTMGYAAGSSSNGDSEFGVSTSINGASVGIVTADSSNARVNVLSLGTTVGDFATTLKLVDTAGTQTSSVELVLAPGVKLKAANSGDVTLNMSLAF